MPPESIEFELKRQDVLHSLPTATQRLTNHLSRLGEKFEATLGIDLIKGRVPTVNELHQFALILEADELWLDTFAKDLDSDDLALFSPVKIYNSKLHRQLREFVADDGQINERGFTEMRVLTEELSRVEFEARRKAQDLKKDSSRNFGEVGEFDIINDRYVLPVSSDKYSASHGAIIHRSRTGQTLYTEPQEMRPYSLRRSELLAERDWLIFRKCRELGESLTPIAKSFDQWGEFALQFDRLQSLMRFAKDNKLVRPVISDCMGMELTGLFHPLVEDCITNDISLNDSLRGFILSGPNTGGKTVLLKSIALTTCLVRIGGWAPCESCSIYPYSQLYFFSHDLQDIGAGLSSFSSEVKNYSQLVEELKHDALVIIDEIFNSTSSEEASALAVALLEHLEREARPHVLLSTHHHGIKTTASTMSNFLSCHMAVDARGMPLYQVVWGTPGSSRGIDTFNRLTQEFSWGKRLSKRAKELLGSQVFDYESALTEINAQRAEYLLRTKEADEQILQLRNEREAFRLQKEMLLDQQHKELAKRYERIVTKAKQEIEIFKKGESSPRRVLDALATGKRELSPQLNRTSHAPSGLAPLPQNCEGLRVWSKTLGKSGLVLQDKDSKLQVDFKGLKSWCKRSDLQLQPGQTTTSTQVSVTVQREVKGKLKVDGRGMRLELFQSDVISSLQELLNGEIPYLDIVHGHGDGILKKWVRQYLKQDSDYEWAPLDGNDGATRVQLRK